MSQEAKPQPESGRPHSLVSQLFELTRHSFIYGIGGIGINAVQGASHVGATHVIAVDPVEFKRETAQTLGATHSFATMDEAAEFARSVTNGQGADSAIVTVRPWNTFGVRMRARIAPCGPPRAALLVLEDPTSRPLRAVG